MKDARAAMERANELAVAKAERLVNEQYEAVMLEVEKAANIGRPSVEYRHNLKPETIKLLKANGFGVRDDGEGVADLYRIVWA